MTTVILVTQPGFQKEIIGHDAQSHQFFHSYQPPKFLHLLLTTHDQFVGVITSSAFACSLLGNG
jgi:hypothetical protein